jgi:hypothetical protein
MSIKDANGRWPRLQLSLIIVDEATVTLRIVNFK